MPVKNDLRTTLLACLVLLGLQFLFPIALRAAAHPAVFGECSAPPAGSDEDGPGPDEEKSVEVTSVYADHFNGSFEQETGEAFLRGNTDRLGLWLLPGTGHQPSAP